MTKASGFVRLLGYTMSNGSVVMWS